MLLGGYFVFFGVQSIRRNILWGKPIDFYTDILKYEPDSVRINNNLGNLYFAAEDIGSGIGRLYSLDKNGSQRWVFDGGAAANGTNPVIDSKNRLYQIFGTKLYKIGL